eukprot:2643423-Ditylum_brightwellii.AAC.1
MSVWLGPAGVRSVDSLTCVRDLFFKNIKSGLSQMSAFSQLTAVTCCLCGKEFCDGALQWRALMEYSEIMFGYAYSLEPCQFGGV